MPEVIPPVIAPYIENDQPIPSLSLVTSTLSTPVHWILLRHAYAALSSSNEPGRQQLSSHSGSEKRQPVILVSLLRPRDLWLELCRKIGLDLPSLSKSGHFIYIDGLTLAGAENSSPFPATNLKSSSLEDLSNAISQALRAIGTSTASQGEPSRKPLIIIDGLDFLLASQPELDAVRLQQFLSKTLASIQSLVISCNADMPLLHQHDETATPLEREHASFISTMAHQARFVFQARGLDTGAARDVTGVVRISPGGGYEVDQAQESSPSEGEWLYQCKGDGSVRVWSRGE